MVLIIFWAALFTFVSGQLLRIPLGSGVVIQITDIAVFAAVTVWGIREVRNKQLLSNFHHPFTKPITLFIFVCLLSLLFNSSWLSVQQLFVSSLYLIRWVVYVLVFYVVKSFPPERKKEVVRSLIIASGIIVFLGFIQYIFYPNLRNLYYLGWDEHLYRLFSTILDPNFAAAILCLSLFLLLGIIFNEKKQVGKYFIGAIVLFVCSFTALLLTYSRGGFLTFVAGSIIFFILLRKRLYLLGLLAVFVIGIIIIPKDLRSSGVELWRTASIFARTDAAKQAFEIYADRPVLGVGFDTYRYAQKEYGFAADKNWEVSHSGGGTDSSILFVLATTGIVGLVAYLNIWKNIIARTLAQHRKNKTYLSLVILSSIGGIFVNSFFINSLFYPFIMFWMWVMLGIIESKKR